MSLKPASKAFTVEARIKRRLRAHLSKLGFNRAEDGSLVLPDAGKETVRTLHRQQRRDLLAESVGFIEANLPRMQDYFASGDEVDVSKIKPVLQRISGGTWESNLFRLASLTWSVPVSAGFGRRIRYLVWDESNGKLIGIVAIGDPVYNLAVRDDLIGWTVADRADRLVCVMDAYVLGSVPPYNTLLGGKLVASLLRTRRVHVCNWTGTSSRIPVPLHRAISLSISRVRRAVLTPVIRVTSTPVRLRSRLVIPVVGVDAKSPPLPTASAFPLTRRGRAVPLIGDPQNRMKRIAAGKAKSGRFHDGAPR